MNFNSNPAALQAQRITFVSQLKSKATFYCSSFQRGSFVSLPRMAFKKVQIKVYFAVTFEEIAMSFINKI